MRHKRPSLLIFIALITAFVSSTPLLPQQITDNKATDIGNVGLTVTSFGRIGNGFNASFWPAQPSCEFPVTPVRSRIEHLFNGGLWVGAIRSGQLGVTTATIDRNFAVREFTQQPGQGLTERSSLLDSRYYSRDAVSHQDFVADYTDSNLVNPQTNERLVDHFPLYVSVHQETYAWKYSIADFFIILNFKIRNVGTTPLDSVYVGFVTDFVVRNTNYRLPTEGSPFYQNTALGYIDSLRMHYAFDYDGNPTYDGITDNYIGLKLLGTEPLLTSTLDSLVSKCYYQAWGFRLSTGDPDLQSPANDQARYEKMSTRFPTSGQNVEQKFADLKKPGNRYTLYSVGPFPVLNPNDSITVTFALVLAKKYGDDPQSEDTPLSKKTLVENAIWAQKTYNGEDINGNGILDPGEDLDGDGKITRYIFPTILPPPKVKIVAGDRKATLYWDNSVESAIDPILNKKDFEGYRIFGTKAGYDFGLVSGADPYILLADFDRADDSIGYNTGFTLLRCDTTFPDDPVHYTYRYEIPNLLNGWQYSFGIEAYDQGDPANNLPSQPSIRVIQKVIPGTPATSNPEKEVGVYPNPYYVHALWDGTRERERKLYFYNLPANCEVRIYTLAGDLIASFEHHADSYNGTGIQWFSKFADGTQKMSGGEHAWDLITKGGQAVATGLYLFTVKDMNTGDIKRGKFAIIK